MALRGRWSTSSTRRGRLWTESVPATKSHSSGPERPVRHHEGHDGLAQVVVGHADHGRLLDRRVGQQGGLHLAGADSVAAALDQVGGLPAHDAIPAGRVHARHVTGSQPAVLGVERRRGLGQMEVAVHDGRRSNLEFADAVAVGRHRVAMLVDQTGVDAGEGGPTQPARRWASARAPRVISVSVIP